MADIYPVGQCTWWVASQASWIQNLPALGDARYWLDNASKYGGVVTHDPVPGAVAVFEPGVGGAFDTGHVGYVTGVNGDGSYTMTEMNFEGNGGGFDRVDTRTVTPGNTSGFLLAPGSSSVAGGVPNPVTTTSLKTTTAGFDFNPLDIPGEISSGISGAIGAGITTAIKGGEFFAGLILAGVGIWLIFGGNPKTVIATGKTAAKAVAL